MHILRSRIFLGFLKSYLKNAGSLGVVWFLKVAVAACLWQYCNNSKKNFGVLRKTFFKCMELSGISFSVERAGLNIGYRLMELEAESCTASLCYWKTCEGITGDTWVMVLLYKLCWGRKYLSEFQSRINGTLLALILWPFQSRQHSTCNEMTFLSMDCAQRQFLGPSLARLERYNLK